jgi:hypothetical protein
MASGFRGGVTGAPIPIPPLSITGGDIAFNTIPGAAGGPGTSKIVFQTIQGHADPLKPSDLNPGSLQGHADPLKPSDINPGSLQGAVNPAIPSDINSNSIKGSGLGGPPGDIALASIDTPDIKPGAITSGLLSPSALPSENMLTNSSFAFAQLYDPNAPFSPVDNVVGFDAWKTTFDTGTLTFNRVPSGISPFLARLTKNITAGKFMMYQGLDNLLTAGLSNNTVQFQCCFTPSVNMNIKMAILSWGGVANVLPNPIVTAWNGIGVDPTFDPAISVLFAPVLPFTMLAGVFYTWSVFSGLVPANNYIVAIWSDSPLAAGDSVDIEQPGLYKDVGLRSWQPLSSAEEHARAERFIEKSYNRDDEPGKVTNVGVVGGVQVGSNMAQAIRFRVPKAKPYGVNVYSPNTGAIGNWFNSSAVADMAAANIDAGDSGFTSLLTGSGANGDGFKLHFVADGSL